MAVPHALPAALGAIAILPTTAILVIHIVLAQSLTDSTSPVRITAIVAGTLEAVALVAVSCLSYSHIASRPRIPQLRKLSGIWFGAALFLCVVAAAVSVAAMICLGSADLPNTILGSQATKFLIGASVTLGLAFAAQLVFLVFHFVASRIEGNNGGVALQVEEDRNRSHERIKAIAYHHTSAPATKTSSTMSVDSRTPPGSSSGRSATETMSSIRSSLSHVVRPISSKTRLLSGSQRSSRRPASLEVASLHDHRPRSNGDGFDSWDTSNVDPQNRQTVLETSSPPLPRFLETIPASPTTSRSPSPGTPLDLEPPRSRRRSRSYSPASTNSQQTLRPTLTQHSSHSESHIHPLFRSDSPAPPAITTPGTVVLAAPNAGQITDRQSIRSIRSLTRMRSGSLPAHPSPLSTLSRQGSLDSFHQRTESSSPEIREEDETAANESERKMTPPIPDWILSAGCRTSLSGYNSRKLKTPGDGDASPVTEV
ncbi:hypothetical protein B0T26DRAFT_643768 [Lasiosphaeria miniovina]|uniref:Uncharacterized protein n=1 Tax=Lasiosphaeria miniovina TaxID=1954250 RepID=A0AA40AUZ9_9PEZI|nr:uncharacterized protein B0T26DRAFT_643768 [Lasiosphaeria miniovina]KAK0722503.1 hypothetical protein B0T26DRAFT_643768 [Lasiosphaeria miniovina]